MIIPSRINRQPQRAVRIDWRNPITRGLICAISAGSALEHVTGKPLSLSGAVRAPFRAGMGVRSNGASSYGYVDLPNKVCSEISLFVLTSPTALALNGEVFGLASMSSSNPIVRINTGNTTSSKIRFWLRGDNGSTLNSTGDSTNTAFAVGSLSAIGISAKGNNGAVNVYINGVVDPNSTTTIANQWTINRASFGALSFQGGAADFYAGYSAIGLAWRRILTAAEHKSIAANPWQVFRRRRLTIGSVVTVQYARPTSDVTTGAWVSSLGGSLAAAIDETPANDADYIGTTYGSTCEAALGSLADPTSSTSHKVRYRIAADAGAIVVRLRQGATTIASWTHNPAPTSLTTFEQTLSGAEADSITDYSALKLQFEAF